MVTNVAAVGRKMERANYLTSNMLVEYSRSPLQQSGWQRQKSTSTRVGEDWVREEIWVEPQNLHTKWMQFSNNVSFRQKKRLQILKARPRLWLDAVNSAECSNLVAIEDDVFGTMLQGAQQGSIPPLYRVFAKQGRL